MRNSIICIVTLIVFMSSFSFLQAQERYSRLITDETTKTFKNVSELEIENVTGNIKIIGWEKNSIEVTYIRKAKRERLLEDIEVFMHVTNNSLMIDTDIPQFCNQCAVDFIISVPKSLNSIDAKTITGTISLDEVDTVENLRCKCITGQIGAKLSFNTADLSIVTGSITLSLLESNGKEEIYAKTITGSINLYAPSNFNAKVNLSAVTGSINTDFPVSTIGKIKHNRLEGKIGDGQGRCELKTTTGSINLKEL